MKTLRWIKHRASILRLLADISEWDADNEASMDDDVRWDEFDTLMRRLRAVLSAHHENVIGE